MRFGTRRMEVSSSAARRHDPSHSGDLLATGHLVRWTEEDWSGELKTVEIAVPLPENGECELCLDRLRDSLTLIKGVDRVEVHPERYSVTVGFDPELAPLSSLEDVARDLGAGIGRRYAHETLTITEMDCADCAAKLETAIGRLPGVLLARVSFAAGTMRLEYEPDRVSRAEVVGRLQGLGYGLAEPVVVP